MIGHDGIRIRAIEGERTIPIARFIIQADIGVIVTKLAQRRRPAQAAIVIPVGGINEGFSVSHSFIKTPPSQQALAKRLGVGAVIKLPFVAESVVVGVEIVG